MIRLDFSLSIEKNQAGSLGHMGGTLTTVPRAFQSLTRATWLPGSFSVSSGTGVRPAERRRLRLHCGTS